MWRPVTFEDELLEKFLDQNPGEMYLEVPIGNAEGASIARRIDGVLISGETSTVFSQNDYNLESFKEKIKGQVVYVIEAKRELNRGVIGQVEVGAKLLAKEFEPSRVEKVVLCSKGNKDLEWYCKESNITVSLYLMNVNEKQNIKSTDKKVSDIRQAPDLGRKRAFYSGWSDAIKGNLYKSAYTKKTHANMGNLFGWIYGDQSKEFKEETWERYIKHSSIEEE
ncbi:hypothetical protein [Natranaerobius trueperi]|uniref:Uncharacterized protein n=1 Tax=Natranaerobius trueperi TaxID=759412 RepID=A0A226BYT7_9FIRM|nr:hypothetical protein [Natranaerobius trueperi]OWZ84091.1 hypothetical protein CDO51_05085 [Natranaerobius trueperi]